MEKSNQLLASDNRRDALRYAIMSISFSFSLCLCGPTKQAIELASGLACDRGILVCNKWALAAGCTVQRGMARTCSHGHVGLLDDCVCHF